MTLKEPLFTVITFNYCNLPLLEGTNPSLMCCGTDVAIVSYMPVIADKEKGNAKKGR